MTPQPHDARPEAWLPAPPAPWLTAGSTGARRPPAPVGRSPALRQAHERRMHAVLAHIEANLAANLSLERLASLAAFSPFHFHRVFVAWTGETLKTHVRRRRLEQAAERLAQCPHDKVADIAQSCGFASPEAFARAFRERYGVSPSAWRTAPSRRDGEH